jgi:hypothetical protein
VSGMAGIYPFGTYIRTTCQKPQHTTTNMSHAALPPSTDFRPLPSWVGQRHHQIMVLPLHRLVQGEPHRVRWRCCWFPCLGRQCKPHQ